MRGVLSPKQLLLSALFVVIAIGLSASHLRVLAQPNSKGPQLKGTLLIQWDSDQRFIYLVDPNDPLTFVTADGRTIKPGRMYTDGGSIPRIFWSAKGFSPWGYGPAYVIHDWLFHQHQCGRDAAPNNFSFEEANQFLEQAIAILETAKKVSPNSQARNLIKWAVDTFGQSAWAGACSPDPASKPHEVGTITIGRVSLSD